MVRRHWRHRVRPGGSRAHGHPFQRVDLTVDPEGIARRDRAAEFLRPDESVPKEITSTEYVSPRGVRAITSATVAAGDPCTVWVSARWRDVPRNGRLLSAQEE
jgi:hypothetical protein